MKKAVPALSFGSALSHEPADKRIEILRRVGDSGSISQAARDAGVSYKAAWQAIDTLSNLAGGVLVQRAVGGAGGGGALITDAGKQLLAIAAQLAESRRQVLDAAAGAPPSALSHIGLRTSMRNQFPCRVDRLERKGQTVRVFLRLPGDSQLVSRITRASAELLGLKKNLEVLTLCKATAVRVAPQAAVPTGGQQLSGRAQRVSRGVGGDEVSLLLDAGLLLVGFAAAGSGIRVRTPVNAQIDESAVVVALPA